MYGIRSLVILLNHPMLGAQAQAQAAKFLFVISLGRPTSLANCRFYRDSSVFCWLFRQLPSELAERSSTKTGHMLGIQCDLKMDVRYLGMPSPAHR